MNAPARAMERLEKMERAAAALMEDMAMFRKDMFPEATFNKRKQKPQYVVRAKVNRENHYKRKAQKA